MNNIPNDALAIINEDQSFDTVVAIIEGALDTIDGLQWYIGDILVFLRFRSGHAPVAEYELQSDEEWPPEFLELLRQKNLRIEHGYKDEMLHWHRMTLGKLVILYDQKQFLVWQKVEESFPTDQRFESYLDVLSGRLQSKLNGKTLWAYYITSHTYPDSTRLPHIAWTSHFEGRNLAAIKARNTPHSPYSVEKQAQMLLPELADDGKAKTTIIRKLIHKEKQKEQGFNWVLPAPRLFEICLKDSNETRVVIELFEDTTYLERKHFWSYIGVGFQWSPYPNQRIHLYGNELWWNGRQIGVIPLLDRDPMVDRVIIKLAGAMKWVIKPDSAPRPTNSKGDQNES